MAAICLIDDKHVPLYRIVWIADVPHFCGEADCMHEGDYEVRLDVDDSLWTNSRERDDVLAALSRWCSDPRGEEEDGECGHSLVSRAEGAPTGRAVRPAVQSHR